MMSDESDKPRDRLLAQCDSLAARVRELEAREAALRERAQEVRRAWDALTADDFPSGPVYRDIVAAIDALCPPSDTQADARLRGAAPLTPGDLERLAERASMFREAGMPLAAEAIDLLLAEVKRLRADREKAREALDNYGDWLVEISRGRCSFGSISERAAWSRLRAALAEPPAGGGP